MQNQAGNFIKEMNNYFYSGRNHYPFGLSVHGDYIYIANAYRKTFARYPKDLAGGINNPVVQGVDKWSTSGWAWDVKVSDSGVYVANYNTKTIQNFLLYQNKRKGFSRYVL